MKPYTTRNQQMISLLLGGKTLQEIGDLFGVSRERVRQITVGYKRPKKTKPKLTQEERIKIRKEQKEKEFWSLINKETASGCWEWQGTITPMGYGKMSNNEYAHRLSYKYTFGEIPKGKHVLHKCDNPLCVHPFHLFLGDQKDNNKDRDKKGRNKIGTGKSNIESRLLTIEQATQMRKDHKNGDTVSFLAKKFGVSYQIAHNIIKNKTHKKRKEK